MSVLQWNACNQIRGLGLVVLPPWLVHGVLEMGHPFIFEWEGRDHIW